jgi:hypothetical protein
MLVAEIEKPFIVHQPEQNPVFQLHSDGQKRKEENNRIENILPLVFIEKTRDQKVTITVNSAQVYERNQYAVNNTETEVVKLVKTVEEYCEKSKHPEQELNNSEVYIVHANTPCIFILKDDPFESEISCFFVTQSIITSNAPSRSVFSGFFFLWRRKWR